MSTETILDFYAVTKELRIFAEASGYTVVFKADGDNTAPSANSRGQISLTKPSIHWSHEQMLEWKWQCYHEIGHQVPEMRDMFALLADKKIDLSKMSLFGGILNILDDHRQERYRLGYYPGRDAVLSKGGAQFMRNSMVPRMDAIDINSQERVLQMLDVMVGGDATFRSVWQRDYIGVDTMYQKHFNDEQKAWLDKLLSFKNDVHEMETAQDVYELTKRIISEVFDEDEEEQEQEAQGSGEGDEGSSGEGEADGAGQGNAGSDDDTGSGKQAGKGKPGDEKGDTKDAAGKVKYEDLLQHQHKPDHLGASYSPLEIDYSNSRRSGAFSPDPNPRVHDFANGTGTPGQGTEYTGQASRLATSTGLSNRIRKLLQVKSQSITVYGQKKGKLAGKNVYRATMNGTGQYQNQVFKKKIDNHMLDTAVTVLADFSGSMGGEKQVHNIASALMLNDALAKIGVPIEILGFTEDNQTDMYVFKTHQKQVGREKLLESMGRASAYNMGANADGEAISWAYDRLRRQKNKRKLLIVLSDGQPASWRGGDIDEYTKEVIKAIERKKDVEIYGIGIMSNNVTRLYSHNRVIHRASELEDAVLNVIKDYIIN